jgi:hypothetical protein
MSVIVPDDIWREVRQHYARASKRLGRFIETHPEQGNCIAPTGKEMIKLGELIRALTRANKAEKQQG